MDSKKVFYIIVGIFLAIAILPVRADSREPEVKFDILKKGSYYHDSYDLAKKLTDMNLQAYYISNYAADIETLAFIPKGLEMTTGWKQLKENADLGETLKKLDRNNLGRARLYRIEFSNIMFLYTGADHVRLNTKYARLEGNKIVSVNARNFRKPKAIRQENRRR